MERRAHLRNSGTGLLLLVTCFLLTGCFNPAPGSPETVVFKAADVSKIPDRRISATDPKLTLVNGIYFVDGQPFSGFITRAYPGGVLQFTGSYFQGKQHGIAKTWYPNGKLRDQRSYKANVGYGRHFGFWEDGKMKFDFFYIDDRLEGVQKQWYPSGQIYLCLTYKNDVETGMQKGWRENGKLFANYEVKDGIRYGLQKTNLCYTLRNEKLKLK